MSRPEAPARDPEPAVAPSPPAEAPPAPAANSQIPIAVEPGGYYLQLGAFGSKENAETFLARMKTQMGESGDNLHVYTRDGLYRVHAGPYANQGEARASAERMTQEIGLKPMVLTR